MTGRHSARDIVISLGEGAKLTLLTECPEENAHALWVEPVLVKREHPWPKVGPTANANETMKEWYSMSHAQVLGRAGSEVKLTEFPISRELIVEGKPVARIWIAAQSADKKVTQGV